MAIWGDEDDGFGRTYAEAEQMQVDAELSYDPTDEWIDEIDAQNKQDEEIKQKLASYGKAWREIMTGRAA